MARRSIGDIRRAELSQAAFDALVKYGMRGTTLDRVAKIAGVSKGVVLHHFAGKDALFEAVQRKANTVLRDCVVELLRHADTPLERLYAIIAGNFAEPVFQQEICHAWISLCSDVPHHRQSQRIQAVVHARMRSNLLSALMPMMDIAHARQTAFQLRTVMDGIWLRASFQKRPMPGARGIDEVHYAARHLLRDRCDVAEMDAARQKMEQLSAIMLNTRAFREQALTG